MPAPPAQWNLFCSYSIGVKFFAENKRSGFNWGANFPLAFSILPNDRPAKPICHCQSIPSAIHCFKWGNPLYSSKSLTNITLKTTLLTVVCNDHLNLNIDYLEPTCNYSGSKFWGSRFKVRERWKLNGLKILRPARLAWARDGGQAWQPVESPSALSPSALSSGLKGSESKGSGPKGLQVERLARELTQKVYHLTKKSGFAKDYGLKRQIQDAAGSSMHNIAGSAP